MLTTQNFGGLTGRSAVNLTICFTHDLERALNEGLTDSMLTLDFKGAFDDILPGRLISRMRKLGWQGFLVNWFCFFATNSSVQVRLDGETESPHSVNYEVFQESPISPILWKKALD